EGRLLRELLHRPFLAVLVDVLERDPGFLHERDGQGPLVERAAEGDAARFDVDHPLLSHVLREPLADAVVDLRDDLRESLLHLLVVVHEELRARELFGDHPRARDEGVGEGCFPVIDVCRGADVADALLQMEQGLGLLDILFFTSHGMRTKRSTWARWCRTGPSLIKPSVLGENHRADDAIRSSSSFFAIAELCMSPFAAIRISSARHSSTAL